MQDDKRQSVSLLNSISNFPDAPAASANLTPSSRSGGSGVMEVFPPSAASVNTGNFSCGRLCLTHAKFRGGGGEMQVSTRFYTDAGFVLPFFHQGKHHFFVEEHRRQDINFTGRRISTVSV